jgi:hypothetical protein
MTVPADEWVGLRTKWRGEPTTPRSADALVRLRQRVHRHDNRMRLVIATEVALTVFVIAVAWSSLMHPSGRGVLPAIATFVLIVACWAFAIWNRRGSWRPLSESTSEYLRLSRVRARAGQRSIRFARLVLGLALVGYVPWFVLRWTNGDISGSEWWWWLVLLGYGIAAWWIGLWRARAIDADLEMLRDTERDLSEVDS